jgi:hypothetical protein
VLVSVESYVRLRVPDNALLCRVADVAGARDSKSAFIDGALWDMGETLCKGVAWNDARDPWALAAVATRTFGAWRCL